MPVKIKVPLQTAFVSLCLFLGVLVGISAESKEDTVFPLVWFGGIAVAFALAAGVAGIYEAGKRAR